MGNYVPHIHHTFVSVLQLLVYNVLSTLHTCIDYNYNIVLRLLTTLSVVIYLRSVK